MHFVYVLRSEKTGRRYIGCTQDVAIRLKKHNSGATPSTRTGRPWRVIHTEEFALKSDALSRERFLKSGQGREYLDRILST
ncbi:MAG TPA: GIY-YIG nuclease family protein [Chthoniobacterales bacterium]